MATTGLALALLLAACGRCGPDAAASRAAGAMVSVGVELEGRTAALYPAPDGSVRRYFEARTGDSYKLVLQNRTRERLAVLVNVDGLNVIDGEIEARRGRASEPGPMYVLEPGRRAAIQGWRRSLDEVQRFTFVDERRSYAVRSGKDNPRLGWVEVAVYREQRPRPVPLVDSRRWREEPATDEPVAGTPPAAAATPAPPAATESATAGRAEATEGVPRPQARRYPGTGWGERTTDRAVRVAFDAQAFPSERVTLRYEYRHALVALGVLPPCGERDRLAERERGERGFAAPPPR
jgi:hypothetical protein